MNKKEIKLELIKEGDFLGIKCNFYKDEGNNIYMTRQQIGEALEYKNPDDAIYRIHNRNKDRLDNFSVRLKITADDGKKYNTTLYNEKGILEIIKSSTQPIQYKESLLKSIGYPDDLINTILSLTSTVLSEQNDLQFILSHTYFDCDIKTEVTIDDYRVDFLLNHYIIIECDENGHSDRDINYEKTREDYLTQIGYKIFRYNPHSEEENKVQKLIESINRELNKKYNIKYPSKMFNKYDSDLLVKINKAKRLWGGYIYDVEDFTEIFRECLNQDEFKVFKDMVFQAKVKQDKMLI